MKHAHRRWHRRIGSMTALVIVAALLAWALLPPAPLENAALPASIAASASASP
jgi:hypothetical protein